MTIDIDSKMETRIERNLPSDLEWDRVAAASPWATPFQRSGWYRAWIEHAAMAEGVEPRVLTIWRGGTLVGGAAMQVRSLEGRATLEPLSTPWADYHDAVADSTCAVASQALCHAVLGLAQSERASLAIEGARAHGVFAEHLASPVSRASVYQHQTIDLCDSKYIGRILARREFVEKRRRLGRAGVVACRHHVEPVEIQSRMDAFIAMHRSQWAGRPDAVAPFDGGVVDLTFRGICDRLAPRGAVVLTELLLDGEPIAFYLGFRDSEVYYAYRTTYDRRWYRLSPGHYILHELMVDLPAYGIRTLDLMRGNYAYKQTYSNASQDVVRFTLHPEPY